MSADKPASASPDQTDTRPDGCALAPAVGSAGSACVKAAAGPGEEPGAGRPGLGERRTLDPRFLITERITSLLVSAALLAGAAAALGLDLLLGWWEWPWRGLAWLGFASLAGLLAWTTVVWPRMVFRATSYRYGPAGMEIRRGVWWRRVQNIPASRIQHTDVTQGPLLRRYGLAMLTVHTAASRTPSVTVSGLAHAEALAVRDELTRARGGDGV